MEIFVVVQNIEFLSNDNGNMIEENLFVINVYYENVEENLLVCFCNRLQLYFIENFFNKYMLIKVVGIFSCFYNNVFSMCSGCKMCDRNKIDVSIVFEEVCCQEGFLSVFE